MTVFQVADGVYGIDIGLFDSGVGSVYLFDDDQPALVDAGTAASVETILDAMRECGVAPAELEHILLSHVHVDHTGATPALVEAASDPTVYIHEMTAPHLIDPGALIESSRRAMGEHFEEMGTQEAVPAEVVVEVSEDGTTVDTGDHTLEMHHAPGHSPDHFAVWNPQRRLLFAAECLGMYFQRADRWAPPSSLPNFDVDVLASTIDRLDDLDPETVVFPHFGVWPDHREDVFETARSKLDRFDRRILDIYEETGSVEETKAAVAEELIDLSPPYVPQVESFYAHLVTSGFLKHHGHL